MSIQLHCTVDRVGAAILSLKNMSTKEQSPYQTVNIDKKSVPREVCKKLSLCPLKGGIKKSSEAKGLNLCGHFGCGLILHLLYITGGSNISFFPIEV